MSRKEQDRLGATPTRRGVNFKVWAPFAKHVAVSGDWNNWGKDALEGDEQGYWSGTVAAAEVGQAYKYVITTSDGHELNRNDPRARQLTDSDTGSSVITDDDFDWSGDAYTPPLPEQQVIYELHIGTFNRPDASTPGTFQTAIEKLDYLKNLGVTTIELMPITSMLGSSGWGYAPNYIFAVESSLGGRHGLLEFVKAAHQKGLGVLLDVVYNHFYPKTDLWQFDGWHQKDYGGIYFYNDERGETPWGGRPDYGRPEVREFILDNIAMWLLEYHVDGFRVDSTIYMRNTNGPEGRPDHNIPEAWTLLQEMTTLAHKIKPSALMVAEDSSGEAAITAPVKQGGAGFDTQWGLAFPHAVRQALGMENDTTLESLASELQHVYNDQTVQKVAFADSHDTAANGSVRLNEASDPNGGDNLLAQKRLLIASALTLTAPGIPMMLQGQEFLQEGSFNDWQQLEWERTEQFNGIVLAHQHLLALRHNAYGNSAGLTGRGIQIIHNDDINFVLGFSRFTAADAKDTTVIIANCGPHRFKEYDITLPAPGSWHVRFNSSWRGYNDDFHEVALDVITTDETGHATISLTDHMVMILSQD